MSELKTRNASGSAGMVGIRGPIGGKSEAGLVKNLITELRMAQNTEATRDADGNRYHGVDSYILDQSITVLDHYLTLLTEQFDELATYRFRYAGLTAEQLKALRKPITIQKIR